MLTNRNGNSTEFQAIVFDFDYTLADSSQGVVKCVNAAMGDLSLPSAPPQDICATIGMSLAETFVKLTGQQHTSHSQEFVARFKHHADQVMANLTVLFPAVGAVARFLRQRSIKLGIVSTKFRYRIEEILERDRLRNLFDVIVGGEDVYSHKPDPEGLYRAAAELQCSYHDTLYVGDSSVDAETAKRATVTFLAVLSGVTNREEFANYPSIGIIEKISQLPEWLSL